MSGERLSFGFARVPAIRFGAGVSASLGELARGYGVRAMVVTGGGSFARSGGQDRLAHELAAHGVNAVWESATGEPAPELVDDIAGRYRESGIDVVIAVGGGSAIDTGKAVSAMLPVGRPVIDFLEGVGTGEAHPGLKAPFIAVPTTAGTGSEATRNAVLSRTGPGGFKKSIRHDNFVPDIALIDPALMRTCPRPVTAASGLDAVTQLLESYVSVMASPMTDALALSGLRYAAAALLPAAGDGAGDITVRAGMAYAALLSGITLANAGLGVVHGLASSVGGRIDIPHGVVCGTLLAAATRVTIEKLRDMGDDGRAPLERYAHAGAILDPLSPANTDERCDRLVARLDEWTDTLDIPRLGAYGLSVDMVGGIARETSPKYNPGVLTTADIARIIEMRR